MARKAMSKVTQKVRGKFGLSLSKYARERNLSETALRNVAYGVAKGNLIGSDAHQARLALENDGILEPLQIS